MPARIDPDQNDARLASTRTAQHTGHAGERAWTLVEMLVVLIIIAILMAGILISFRSTKRDAYTKEAISTGNAYAQAFSQYMVDHANNAPPPADLMTISGEPAGPKNLLGKPYLKTLPDGVIAGRVGVSQAGNVNCGAAKATPTGVEGENGWVSYCTSGTAESWIRVAAKSRNDGTWDSATATLCYLGSTARQPRCAL